MDESQIEDWILGYNNFVLYRTPSQSVMHAIRAKQTLKLQNIADLEQIKQGLVFAPFKTGTWPVIVINNAEQTEFEIGNHIGLSTEGKRSKNLSDSYSSTFKAFHKAVSNGQFSKLVLARTDNFTVAASPISLFFDACAAYPESFVYLFASAESGMWLGATPEILLEGSPEQMHTVALAGTMACTNGELPDIDSWDAKNRNEQKIVTDYLLAQIQTFGNILSTTRPQSVRAAHLAHLKTDIFFNINGKDLPELISALHPTPAVCGLPKDEAIRFINENEPADREYYAGFLGWYDAQADTRLFVNLRCMKWIDKQTVKLMAGGGILPESELESEWRETENKMQTLTRLNSFR
ncbi:MAG: isochorismate synthase [Salinivirgaceae bacterium]|nr:isochorismate synthase [Salinivirgaceae bacterium]